MSVWVFFLALIGGFTAGSVGWAEQPADEEVEAADGGEAAEPLIVVEGLDAPPPPSSRGVHRLLTEIARNTIPVDYVNDKDWGAQKEVTRGLRIRREGLRLTTSRRRKLVNHGNWKRYHLRLVEPNKNLKLRVENYTELPNHRVQMDLVIDAKLDVDGRLSKWERGLQLFSVSAAARSDVQLRIRCDVGLVLDATEFPPAVVLDPKVTDANLLLRDFRLRQLSNLRGTTAYKLSSSVREIVEDVIERKRAKLVEKLNAKIDRSRDRLRLSFQEILQTPWADKIQGG